MKKIFYILTNQRPEIKETESIYQETALLNKHFGGESFNIYPKKNSFPFFSIKFFQMEKLKELNHEDNIIIFQHACLRRFDFPKEKKYKLIYSISSSVWFKKPNNIAFFEEHIDVIIVNNDRDYLIAKRDLNIPVFLVRPFATFPTEEVIIKREKVFDGKDFRIIVASAPWTGRQYYTKGFDLLFNLVKNFPELHLTILMRKVLLEELYELIKYYNIGERVKVVNEYVNVYKEMNEAHAGFLMAKNNGIVKSFPNSLMESLIAGNPIICNSTLAISDYVKFYKCGVVTNDFSYNSLKNSYLSLRNNYDIYRKKTLKVKRMEFSKESYVDQYKSIFAKL